MCAILKSVIETVNYDYSYNKKYKFVVKRI
jgi:hypothetical protein